MLTGEQRAEFEARGITRLAGAVERAAVDALRERIWKHLGDVRRRIGSSTLVPPRLTKPLKRAGAFDLVRSPIVCAAVDALLGRGRWTTFPSASNLLMTYPREGRWTLPHKMWHFDYPAPGGVDRLPGVQLFLFVDVVEPRGGGTLIAAGAHRLVARIQKSAAADDEGRSADLRETLCATVPWLRALWSLREGEDREARFVQKAECFESVELQVVELTGEPGDVMLMHPWMPHALSPNCSERVRMMLTERTRAI